MKKYTVIVPAYNEASNIKRCLDHICEYHQDIIVINDGSTDSTRKILNSSKSKKIKVVHLKHNFGKGYAMRVGAKQAFRNGADGVIFMDGDNQHHPKHLLEFIKLLKKGHNIVIGVRLLKTNIPFHRKIGNLLMIGIMKQLFSIDVSDMLCGFRAFSKKGFGQIKWRTDDYGVETEVLTKIGKYRIPFTTIVVDTIYHDKYKGFSLIDGLKIVSRLPQYWMSNS